MVSLTRGHELLRVNEIFHSIQGESSYAGLPCVFIRLTGCNLRCTYCDTKYAYDEGVGMTLDEIVDRVSEYACRLVEITGGEPLIQNDTPRLIQTLSHRGLKVLLETNGSQNLDLVPDDVVRIVDVKCPSSGESDRMDWGNLNRLGRYDEVKFVLMTRSDYDWARKIVEHHQLTERVQVLFSPVFGKLDHTELARWILADGVNARLQVQLHKLIWPDEEKRR